VKLRERQDAELVAEAQKGSREAAGELFERHWLSAWRAAFALTGARAAAEDVVQDSFERAFRALGRFDGRRPFAAWFHRIVVNRALNLVRDERRLTGLEEAAAVAAPDQAGSAADRELLAAVAPLAMERRAVVVLRYGLGYSLVEIAELLAVPLGTVHSRLARALAELRAHYEVEDAERT
jgi:RNA polymerase sigma-70 factor, ECF subfamily